MARKREYKWFVEPLQDASHANAVIARALAQEVCGQNCCETVMCEDGQRRNLWSCPAGLAQRLWESRKTLGISINIWVREGNGQIRNGTFLFQKTMKRILQQARQKAQKAAAT